MSSSSRLDEGLALMPSIVHEAKSKRGPRQAFQIRQPRLIQETPLDLTTPKNSYNPYTLKLTSCSLFSLKRVSSSIPIVLARFSYDCVHVM